MKKTDKEKALVWFDKVISLTRQLMALGVEGNVGNYSRTDEKHIETIRFVLKK